MRLRLKPSISILLALVLTISLYSQFESGQSLPTDESSITRDFSDPAFRMASTISAKDLYEHLSILASDEFEGRETGSPGNDKAASYLAEEFRKLRLSPLDQSKSFFQEVAFTFTSFEKMKLSLNDKVYKQLRDYIIFPQFSEDLNLSEDEIVFLGYGIHDKEYSDYDGQNVEGKVVLAFEGEPINQDGVSAISNSSQISEWSTNWHLKSQAAKQNGAKALILIANDLKKLINDNRRMLVNRVVQLGNHGASSVSGVNTIFLSSKIAEKILADNRDRVVAIRDNLNKGAEISAHISLPISILGTIEVKRDIIQSKNVAGLISGTDNKDEVIVVSAHFDHIGAKGESIYNGADDNSSGTSTVLEIAEAFATASLIGMGPKRSILFLLVTGEEKGLLGSQYYADQPYFPLEKTMANVNIDMVGRWGNEYLENSQDYIYVIGSDRLSRELHDINEHVNSKYSHLLLDYKYNDEKDPNRFYYRSDHYNFARHGIPSIFFFNGVHEDYHRIGDTIDKIDFTLMEKRARHIFHLVWDLSNKSEFLIMNGAPTSAN